MKRPAVLGGPAAFPEGLPLARPAAPPLDEVVELLRPSWDKGVLTNGPLVRQLEAEAAERLGVGHVIAVASCTSGLMLAVQALKPNGPVVLPSFTFSASAHAVAWNGLTPVFAECDPSSFHVDLGDLKGRIDGAGAILATHVFGAPSPAEAIVELGAQAGIPVLFDAAHGFGATRQGRSIGQFGAAEVFSLTPTKPLVAGEGGLVATSDDDLAHTIRIGRDYGNPGDYDTRFAGLNARMSEAHAATALAALARFDDGLAERRRLAEDYRAALAEVQGVVPQVVEDGDAPTYKDVTVQIDPDAFGLSRDAVERALKAEGIETRRYFDPPVHRQQAYAAFGPFDLPVTDDVASRVITLPFYPAMPGGSRETVVEVLKALREHAEDVATST